MHIRTVKVTNRDDIVICYQVCLAHEVSDNFGYIWSAMNYSELMDTLSSIPPALKKQIGDACFACVMRESWALLDRPANVALTSRYLFSNGQYQRVDSYNSGTILMSE